MQIWQRLYLSLASVKSDSCELPLLEAIMTYIYPLSLKASQAAVEGLSLPLTVISPAHVDRKREWALLEAVVWLQINRPRRVGSLPPSHLWRISLHGSARGSPELHHHAESSAFCCTVIKGMQIWGIDAGVKLLRPSTTFSSSCRGSMLFAWMGNEALKDVLRFRVCLNQHVK